MRYSCIFAGVLFYFLRSYAQPAEISIWKDSVMGALYNKATNTVVYNKPDKKERYKIYLSDTLARHEQLLSYSGWSADRQQWAEEWHPSGNYLFCIVEKTEYQKNEKHKRKPVDAIPGYGAYSDLWLLARDGKKAWKLTDLPNNYASGIIHCAISDDGKKFAWTERIAAPKVLNFNLMAGSYVFRVADFVFDSVPRFVNVKTYQPGNVASGGELESFSKDNSTLAFYSTFETKSIIATPIYTLHLASGKINRLTTKSFAQAPMFTPDGKNIIYMTGDECHIFPMEIQGADWWIMDTTGNNKRRLTFMNVKNHPQSVNHYRLAGCLSFMSENCFLGGVMSKPFGLTGYTVKVRFK